MARHAPSFAARYAAGEHEAVWAEMYYGNVTADDRDDVMRQTFERVARNTDRLIERLRDTGYRFECEAGRHGPPVSPRRPCTDLCRRLPDEMAERFGDLPIFVNDPTVPSAHAPHPYPVALAAFAEIVGQVDLRQRHPARPDPEEEAREMARVLQDRPVSPERAELFRQLSTLLEGMVPPPDPEDVARKRALREVDAEPHPQADDPVLARLGDWDPLEVEFDHFARMLVDEDATMDPVEGGGLALHMEIAASFEHKADVSGAWNPTVRLPNTQLDPTVFGEGFALPFTTWLRRSFAQGGFLGVPRPVRTPSPPARRNDIGLLLPDHPIFARLAEGLEPF